MQRKNVKFGSENSKGGGRSLSLHPGPNQDTTRCGDSSPTRTVSDRMQFSNITLRPSGEAAVAGYQLGQSLVSIPLNRSLEKLDENVRGYLGGSVVDKM